MTKVKLDGSEIIEPITVKEYNVNQINSIEKKYPDLRQKSKGPTFLLTYQGTEKALQQQCGFSLEEALKIQANYHELYKQSDEWLDDKLNQASQDGYVTCAFGLKVRTPILKQTLRNTKATPEAAKSEQRTAGNALGQSYGLLNNRAGNAVYELLEHSKHRLDILPVCHIHDAQYFLVKKSPEALHWLNQNLTREMAWQDLPEIQHESVSLSGSLEIFFPSWADRISVDPKATLEDINQILEDLDENLRS